MMGRTKTWVILYAIGIALLVLSLCLPGEEETAPAAAASISGGSLPPSP
jgi:hypothetical protein